jgi:hypothetical protein
LLYQAAASAAAAEMSECSFAPMLVTADSKVTKKVSLKKKVRHALNLRATKHVMQTINNATTYLLFVAALHINQQRNHSLLFVAALHINQQRNHSLLFVAAFHIDAQKESLKKKKERRASLKAAAVNGGGGKLGSDEKRSKTASAKALAASRAAKAAARELAWTQRQAAARVERRRKSTGT